MNFRSIHVYIHNISFHNPFAYRGFEIDGKMKKITFVVIVTLQQTSPNSHHIPFKSENLSQEMWPHETTKQLLSV